MQYSGKTRNVRVRITHGAQHFWSRYAGQECDATLYEGGINPQLNTEQLNPPLPKWQTIDIQDVEVLRDL